MNLEKITKFAKKNRFLNKGALCVALVVTKHAKKYGLPLDPAILLTEGRGQVKGLGHSAVQKILNEHGITKVLAIEGGRTSRGSLNKMKVYVEYLNDNVTIEDIDNVEIFWIGKVNEFFASKPFSLNYDSSKSINTAIHELFEKAAKRQKSQKGSTHFGTMLQHLVGAKLNLILDAPIEHHGASVSDGISKRAGDFVIDDIAIHVTTSPGELLMVKCEENLKSSIQPIIITPHEKVAVALSISDERDLKGRIDIFDAEQFLAGNLYEIGKFIKSARKTSINLLIEQYNGIIDSCETDPSLKILIK